VEERYRNRLTELQFGAGWDKPEPSLWPEPRQDHKVTRWRYSEARQALDEAAEFVSPEQAERRNLICVNPMEGNTYESTRNLVAAYQLVKAGERARSHRHSPSALRLILDAGADAYTVVDGIRVDMAPGDVVLTPSFTWHGHVNEGTADAYWIDFLDIPLVQHLGPMFFEGHPDDYETVEHNDPTSPMRIPTRPALAAVAEADGPRIVEIAAGVMPTIGLHLVDLPAGTQLESARTTATYLYAVVDGEAEAVIEDGAERLDLERGDILAVPAWYRHTLKSSKGATVLRVSDLPMLEALGLRREATAGPA